MFAEMFGIRPWEMDRLDVREFEALKQYVRERNAEAKRAAEGVSG